MQTETQLQTEICEYLTKYKVLFWRNVIISALGRNGRGFRPSNRFRPKGLPDIFIVHAGRIIGIEAKRAGGDGTEREPNGRRRREGKLTPEQAEFATKFEFNGGQYFVVRTMEEAKGVFARTGIIRALQEVD